MAEAVEQQRGLQSELQDASKGGAAKRRASLCLRTDEQAPTELAGAPVWPLCCLSHQLLITSSLSSAPHHLSHQLFISSCSPPHLCHQLSHQLTSPISSSSALSPPHLSHQLLVSSSSAPHHLISPIITSSPNCATRSITRLSATHSNGCLVKSTRAESTLVAGRRVWGNSNSFSCRCAACGDRLHGERVETGEERRAETGERIGDRGG